MFTVIDCGTDQLPDFALIFQKLNRGRGMQDDMSTRRLLATGEEEFAMQQPQLITQPAAGRISAPLMKAAVNGQPVYYFQPSQSVAPSTLGNPPTYFIDPRILQKAQLNTLKARAIHAQNRAQVRSRALPAICIGLLLHPSPVGFLSLRFGSLWPTRAARRARIWT